MVPVTTRKQAAVKIAILTGPPQMPSLPQRQAWSAGNHAREYGIVNALAQRILHQVDFI
jgi:hypothetical protein